jgi:hypothetical protein
VPSHLYKIMETLNGFYIKFMKREIFLRLLGESKLDVFISISSINRVVIFYYKSEVVLFKKKEN